MNDGHAEQVTKDTGARIKNIVCFSSVCSHAKSCFHDSRKLSRLPHLLLAALSSAVDEMLGLVLSTASAVLVQGCVKTASKLALVLWLSLPSSSLDRLGADVFFKKEKIDF